MEEWENQLNDKRPKALVPLRVRRCQRLRLQGANIRKRNTDSRNRYQPSDQNGNDSRVMLMEKQVRQLFGRVPTDPEEYVLASQISQAEAKKYFIERLRIRCPPKNGHHLVESA